MKNALKKRLPAVFVGMLLAVLAAGCGNGEGEIYPLTVDGTAINPSHLHSGAFRPPHKNHCSPLGSTLRDSCS